MNYIIDQLSKIKQKREIGKNKPKSNRDKRSMRHKTVKTFKSLKRKGNKPFEILNSSTQEI